MDFKVSGTMLIFALVMLISALLKMDMTKSTLFILLTLNTILLLDDD